MKHRILLRMLVSFLFIHSVLFIEFSILLRLVDMRRSRFQTCPISHLASSFVFPFLQSLHVINLIHFDLKGFCRHAPTPKVWRCRRSERAIYPTCTLAGGWRGRGGDSLLGWTLRSRRRGGIQRQGRNETSTLKAWQKMTGSVRLSHTQTVSSNRTPKLKLNIYQITIKHCWSVLIYRVFNNH